MIVNFKATFEASPIHRLRKTLDLDRHELCAMLGDIGWAVPLARVEAGFAPPSELEDMWTALERFSGYQGIREQMQAWYQSQRGE